jgi:hypothetical protein
MKYLFACLLFLTSILQSYAQESKDYDPQIKFLSLNLKKPLTIDSVRQRYIRAGFKEAPEVNDYFEQDLEHTTSSENYCSFFRKNQDGVDLFVEAQYLTDGRVYRMSCYMNLGGGKKDDAAMMMLKIVFNNSSKKLVSELGMPTKYYQEVLTPFTNADYDDHGRCAQALRANKLLQSARWISKKYEGTDWAKTPTVEMSLHTLKMLKFSVTDIELLKLSNEKPYSL